MTDPADIAVVGAFAYDQIATTERPLDVQSLRNAKLKTLRRDFGGCGGNLAYSCAKLGVKVFPLGSLGDHDADAYLNHLQLLSIPTSGLLKLPGASPQGLVITDPIGDQFTAFFPGPQVTNVTWQEHLQSHLQQLEHVRFLIQAPFPAPLTEAALKLLPAAARRAQVIWCPGQYADMLSRREIDALLPAVHLVVGNAWEIEYLQRHASPHATLMLRTDGGAPIRLLLDRQVLWEHEVPEAAQVEDPTGCGDALIAAMACQLAINGATLEPEQIRSVLPHAVAHAQKCLAVSGCQAF